MDRIKEEVRKSFLPCSVNEESAREALIKALELMKFFLPVEYFVQFASREPFNVSEDEFIGKAINKRIIIGAFSKNSLGRLGNYEPEKRVNTLSDFSKSKSLGNLSQSVEPQKRQVKETYHPSSKKAKVEKNASMTSFFNAKK